MSKVVWVLLLSYEPKLLLNIFRGQARLSVRLLRNPKRFILLSSKVREPINPLRVFELRCI